MSEEFSSMSSYSSSDTKSKHQYKNKQSTFNMFLQYLLLINCLVYAAIKCINHSQDISHDLVEHPFLMTFWIIVCFINTAISASCVSSWANVVGGIIINGVMICANYFLLLGHNIDVVAQIKCFMDDIAK